MIEAAIELIVERGVEKATLKDIGERAGYSRGLATYRFGSKAGLFRAVIRAVGQRWLGEVTRSVGQRRGVEALCACVDGWSRFVTESPRHIRALHILFYQCIGPDTGFRERVADMLERQRADVATWLRAGIEGGEVDPSIDPRRQAELFCAFIYGWTYQWLVEPGAIDFHGIGEDFKRALRASLTLVPPRKVS
jgi:AcrR family transcriptional regulator